MEILFSLLKSKAKIGHDRYGFGRFLTGAVPASTFEGRHVVDAMQEIALKAGGVPDDRGIEVFWNPEITSKRDTFFVKSAAKIFVGINPGGDRANRRWAPERFALVAAQLIERINARILLLGGPAERDIASSIEKVLHSDVLNLSGLIPLDQLPYVISRLDLLVTNDSGPMHIAAATKTPLVALFGPEDPELFGPYTSPELYRVIHKTVPCRPCGDKTCKSLSCLDQITPDEVLVACVDLLQCKA
jgi:ADP-heptose:LPS heptosyltransferase